MVLLVGSEVSSGDHFLLKLEIPGDVIRIDIDPAQLTAVYPAAVSIQADSRAALRALSSAHHNPAPHNPPTPRDSPAQCCEDD